VEGELLGKHRLEAKAEPADVELAVVGVARVDVGQIELQPATEPERLQEGAFTASV
jgi:hypothetical protein